MVKGSYRFRSRLNRLRFLAPLVLGVITFFSTLESGQASRFAGTQSRPPRYGSLDRLNRAASDTLRAIRISGRGGQRRPAEENWNRYENLSPEDKARLRNRYRQWESLSPEKQQDMRRRMEKWKELPQEDRELLRRRHEQWQELSPQERQGLREKLNRWNDLSPEEQERIRQRFRRPGAPK
jgi:hypothetical protein